MNQFIHMILSELKNSLGAAVAVCFLAVAGIGAWYFHHRRKYPEGKKFPWLQAVLILALTGYLVVVDYATIGRLSGYGAGGVNLHLFRAWREAWNSFSVKGWLNLLLNVAMFLPLGILLPSVWKPFRKWYIFLPTAVAITLFFELRQYLTGRGILDVDDLFANTLGAMMGYGCLMAALSLRMPGGRRIQSCIAYGLLALIPLCATGGIFLAYSLQEYGNFPDAPSFRANTRNTEFVLECPMPENGNTAAVYRAQALSREECDAFGREFGELVHADFHEILYYDKETYFIDRGLGGNGAHFLSVSWLDGSYDYSHIQNGYNDPEILWEEATREHLEELLLFFSLSVPEAAEFTFEGDGWHSFQAAGVLQDGYFWDGTLRCRYGNGEIRQLDNRLLPYALYGEVPILSPEEALQTLRSGWFSGGVVFEHYAPETVSVQSFELTYRIDTKGFYRPVYLFTLACGTYNAPVMIPA